MTKVTIHPGVCGLITSVTAESEDKMEVQISVKSGCPSVQKMLEELGGTFDAFELCLTKPGENSLYQYASEHFPGHAACPVISGILKCVEVECALALPKPVKIEFED